MCTLIISGNLQSCVTITIYQSENTSTIPKGFLINLCSWSPLLPLTSDNPYLLSITTNLHFPDILSLKFLIAIIFYLSIHSCLIVSSLLLLWVRFLWPFTYRFLCGHMFSLFLGRFLGVEFLDHYWYSCVSFLRKLQNSFPKWLFHCMLPSAMCEGSSFSKFLLKMDLLCIFHYNHLVDA